MTSRLASLVGRTVSRNGGPRTRILVVATPPALTLTVPDVFVELVDRGAELVFSGKRPKNVRIPEELVGKRHVEGVVLPLRREEVDEPIVLFRQLCDLAWACGPSLDASPWTRRRNARRALKLLEHVEPDSLARRAEQVSLPEPVHAVLTGALARVERLLPPDARLEEAIRGVGCDAVLLLTRCEPAGPEPDVVKIARRLGVPSIMLVWSWDNLSSKAVLNEHPDRLLVWNEVQAREAEELHGVAREQVDVVGAANFDRFFAEVETAARPAPHEGRATILYLGSSSRVVPDERSVFERWLRAIRSSDDLRVRDARVVLRPHPGGGTRVFDGWEPPDDRTVFVKPRAKIEPRPLAALLAEADAVVALNTSAEIEAAIAGRPVVTFRAGQDAPGQEGSLHFRYLLEEQGGFVRDAATLEDHVRDLAAALRGEFNRGAIAAFVESFVRPAGRSQPVAPLVASTILELAVRQPR